MLFNQYCIFQVTIKFISLWLLLYDVSILTSKHGCLHVIYITPCHIPPCLRKFPPLFRVASQHHATAVSASTTGPAQRTPWNMDASFSTDSFLFHNPVMFSFASETCEDCFGRLVVPKSACSQCRQEDILSVCLHASVWKSPFINK